MVAQIITFDEIQVLPKIYL